VSTISSGRRPAKSARSAGSASASGLAIRAVGRRARELEPQLGGIDHAIAQSGRARQRTSICLIGPRPRSRRADPR
jgi:hypothetical protein